MFTVVIAMTFHAVLPGVAPLADFVAWQCWHPSSSGMLTCVPSAAVFAFS
jgi:hypothetical protein